ncbi:MAG: L,D-transpeptidase [Bacillota bacterium]
MEFDRYAKIKDALIYTGDGLYVSGNDPGLWKKILDKNPADDKALYHVGLSLEKDAYRYLKKYRETNISFFHRLYNQKMAQSLEMLKKSYARGYFPAAIEIQRLKRQMNPERAGHFSSFRPAGAVYALLLLSCFVLGMLMALFLFADRVYVTRELLEEHYTYILPYEVVEGRPNYIPGIDYETRIVEIEATSREAVANNLVVAVKELYQKDPGTPKMVIGVQSGGTGRMEVGMALWAGRNSNIKVYVYPNKQQLLWETTTVIRSALYQFARQNGCLPGDLTTLTRSFPDNYLTSIPRDPYKYSNNVHSFYNGSGGWVYRPEEFDGEESIARVLRPNLPAGDIDFEPLCLYIDKSRNTLMVVTGGNVTRSYRVALGRDDKTPEGDFFIAKKIANPNKGLPGENMPYGTRAMELSGGDFAIHGTNMPSSIGKNVTMGCIRLDNQDMENLYSMIPLYTAVKIFSGENDPDPGAGEAWEAIGQTGMPSVKGVYDTRAGPAEENNKTYAWAG